MSQSPLTRQSLLIRVRDPADNAAWSQFIEIYTPLIYQYCTRRGLQDADASDVAQDVMRSIAQNIGRFEYNARRGLFRGWLFKITRSKLSDFIQRIKGHERGSGRTSIQELLAEQPEEQETQQWELDCQRRAYEWAAHKARAEFTDTTWRAFQMTAVEDRSASEAAEATGLSVGAVYIAKSRVLSRLRQLVAAVSDDQSEPGTP